MKITKVSDLFAIAFSPMKPTHQNLADARRHYAHQGTKVVRAYALAAFRYQAGISDNPNNFASFRWASHCWSNNLGRAYKPFLKG